MPLAERQFAEDLRGVSAWEMANLRLLLFPIALSFPLESLCPVQEALITLAFLLVALADRARKQCQGTGKRKRAGCVVRFVASWD
jgi:hypothetical protein